jgi:hypothetical protein
VCASRVRVRVLLAHTHSFPPTGPTHTRRELPSMPRPLHTPSNHTTHFFAPREPEAALAFTPRVSHVVDSPSVFARIETLPSSFEVARVPLLQQVARVPHVNSGSCPHGNSGSCSTPFALVIFHVLFGNCPTAPSPVLLKRWLVFHPRSKQASYRTATIRPIVASPASSCARLPSRTGSDRIVGRRSSLRSSLRSSSSVGTPFARLQSYMSVSPVHERLIRPC